MVQMSSPSNASAARVAIRDALDRMGDRRDVSLEDVDLALRACLRAMLVDAMIAGHEETVEHDIDDRVDDVSSPQDEEEWAD